MSQRRREKRLENRLIETDGNRFLRKLQRKVAVERLNRKSLLEKLRGLVIESRNEKRLRLLENLLKSKRQPFEKSPTKPLGLSNFLRVWNWLKRLILWSHIP